MREYAEDVDIAPIELMIIVRTVIYRFDGQLMICPGPPISCHDRRALLTTIGQEQPLRAFPWYRLPLLT